MKVAVFDAYGTLFDVNAAARKAADAPDAGAFAAHWPKVAEIWRMKQLEYSLILIFNLKMLFRILTKICYLSVFSYSLE